MPESRLPEAISITSGHEDVITFMVESEEDLKSLLMKVKEESEEVGLKLNIKMAVWGGLTNSCEKKRSEKQRRKGKI